MEMECFVQREVLESEKVSAEAQRAKYLYIRIQQRPVYWLRNKMRLCNLAFPMAPESHVRKQQAFPRDGFVEKSRCLCQKELGENHRYESPQCPVFWNGWAALFLFSQKDLREGGWTNSFYFLKWSLKIFICLLVWLCWVLVVTHRIFSWGMQTLSGSLWNLVPWPGIKPGPPALGVWSLSHWNHQGSPKSFLNFGQAVFKS